MCPCFVQPIPKSKCLLISYGGAKGTLEARGEGSLEGMSSAKFKATHICPFDKPFICHKDFHFALLGFDSLSELSSMSLNHKQM